MLLYNHLHVYNVNLYTVTTKHKVITESISMVSNDVYVKNYTQNTFLLCNYRSS